MLSEIVPIDIVREVIREIRFDLEIPPVGLRIHDMNDIV